MAAFIEEFKDYLYEVLSQELDECLKAINFDESKINRDKKGRFASKLYAKLKQMEKNLKKPKEIDSRLKREGKITITTNSLPFEQGELDYVVNEITSHMSETDYNNGFVTKQLPREKDKKYYFYDLIYDKDGKHHITKRTITNEEITD